MNQVTVNASYDSGVWLTFAGVPKLQEHFQECVSISFSGDSAGGPIEPLLALLRIFREMVPDLEIVYQLGGYTINKALWIKYVLGEDYDASKVP